MLEKESTKQVYVPYEDDLFIKSERISDSLGANAGKFVANSNLRFLSKFATKTLNILASILGIDVYFKNDNPNIPIKWVWILAYLKNEGIIVRHGFAAQYNDYPKLVSAHLIATPRAFITDGDRPSEDIYSNAASLSMDSAISKAIGEFLERFTLLQYKERDLLKSAYRDLRVRGVDALDPRIYANMCPIRNGRYPSEKYNDEKHILWVKMRELSRGSIYMPAQRVFWTYKRQHNGWNECFLAESNSSGGSAGPTLENAILGGIYELIERDAFLIFWLNKLSPPVIKNDSIRHFQSIRKILDDCERYDLDVYVLNTMTDIRVPTCTAVIIDRSDIGPAVSVGAGCSARWESAIESALIEALKIKRGARARREDKKSDVKTLNDSTRYTFNMKGRVDLWCDVGMREHITFFISGKPISYDSIYHLEIDFKNPKDELNHIEKLIRSAEPNSHVYYYQAHHAVLSHLNFFSVMVVIPELVPMYLKEINMAIGANRLRSVPTKLGYESASVFNSVPHPFP